MSDERAAIALPMTDIQLSSADGKLILALETAQGAVAALIPLDQTALLASRLLHWVSTQPPSEQTARSGELMIHDLHFEAGRTNRHIVLSVDLGAATLRFEVPHDQLGAALAQLNFSAGEPPKAH